MKKTLFIILLSSLLLPFIQNQFKIFDFEPLKGAYTKQTEPEFETKYWLDGSFQEKYMKYYDDHLGFKEFFVRSYHQAHYTFFKQTKSKTCIIGKNNQLYLESYVNAYTGADFIGEEEIVKKVDRLKYLEDFLAYKNKTLITVLAPGKGTFYSEYLPDKYFNQKGENTNYNSYKREFDKRNMNVIDFNQHFLEIKESSPYPLYPEMGGHWSEYGMYLAMDSISKYIENKRNIDLPEILLKNVTLSDSMRDPDNDIEKLMNLFNEIPTTPMPYLDLEFNVENKSRPKVLIISDSYFWQPVMKAIPQNVFDFNDSFWYYFNTVQLSGQPVIELDLEKELAKYEVVLLISTDGTLGRFPFGVEHRIYDLYRTHDPASAKEFYEYSIKHNSQWLNSIRQKAQENNFTLEEQINSDAEYMAKEELKACSERDKQISDIIEKIKRDPVWFSQLKEKAKERNLHIDFMCYLDAIFILNQQ